MDAQDTTIQDIAPLLQDNRISGAELAVALVDEFHQGLYALSLSLLLDAEQARETLAKALAEIVAHRWGYWGEIPTAIWINRRVVAECRKQKSNIFRFITAWIQERRTARSNKPCIGILQHLVQLDELERAALALRYGQGLCLEDISAILDTPLISLHISLKSGRQAVALETKTAYPLSNTIKPKGVLHTGVLEAIEDQANGLLDTRQLSALEEHLAGCPACRGRSERVQGAEKCLKQGFSTLIDGDSTGFRELLLSETMAQLGRTQRSKGISISTRQIFYTVLMVAALVGLSWRYILPMVQPFPSQEPMAALPTGIPDPWAGYLLVPYSVSEGESLTSLAEAVGLQVEDLLSLNNMAEERNLAAGDRITLAFAETSFIPTEEGDALVLPTPLTAQSSVPEILERMQQAGELFDTLWGDYLSIMYGPPGYSGPIFNNFSLREQVWLDRTGYAASLQGLEYNNSVEYVIVFHYLPSGIILIRDPDKTLTAGRYPTGGDHLFFPPKIPVWQEIPESRVSVTGTDRILGRAVVVIDWILETRPLVRRLWVDAERGLVLRQRLISVQGEAWTTVMEYGFTALSLDIDLPPEVYSPSRFSPVGFVLDHSGQPRPEGQAGYAFPWSPPPERRQQERITPPEEFDPAGERLTLQWPAERVEGEGGQVEVYAGGYYLGQLSLGQELPGPGNPYHMFSDPFQACRRSPDGRLAALSINLPPSSESNLFWFHIAKPEGAQAVSIPKQAQNEFEFDPSSRFLAYYGCLSEGCGVQLLDTYTNQVRLLFPLSRGAPKSLSWSPDGKYLAMLGLLPDSPIRQIIIVERMHGRLVYQAEYGWTAPKVPADSPTLSWGMPFPIEKDEWVDWYGCAQPYLYPKWVIDERRE